jgi:hypothetical protein
MDRQQRAVVVGQLDAEVDAKLHGQLVADQDLERLRAVLK